MYMQVEICRKQLFMPAQDCTGNPPTPSDSSRDMCSSLLHKTVSLFVSFFLKLNIMLLLLGVLEVALAWSKSQYVISMGKEIEKC